MKKYSVKLPLLFASISLACATVTAGVTFAAFEHSKTINKSDQITSGGRRNTQIFLGMLGGSGWAHVEGVSIRMCKWNMYDDRYFAWEKQQASQVEAENGNYYFVFDLDTTLYNSFSFHRIADTCATAKTVTYTIGGDSVDKVCFTNEDRQKNNTNANDEGFYNASYVLTKPKGKNIYTMKSTTTAGNYGFLSGGDWEDSTTTYTGDYTPIEYAHSPNFKDDSYYISGSGNYATGVSSYGKSRDDVTTSLEMTDIGVESIKGYSTNVIGQYKGTIAFTAAGDRFRIRSSKWPKVTYEKTGAINDSGTGDVRIEDNGNNMYIHTQDTYDIYLKIIDTNEVISYSVYVEASSN